MDQWCADIGKFHAHIFFSTDKGASYDPIIIFKCFLLSFITHFYPSFFLRLEILN